MQSKHVGKTDKKVLPVILRKTDMEYEHIKIAKTVSIGLKQADL